MSETTGEGTYFTVDGGCHGGGQSRCQACGGTSYSMREDAPRCDGCHRVVLKDEGATHGTVPDRLVPEGWSPPAYSSTPSNAQRRTPAPTPPDDMTTESVMAAVLAILHEARTEEA